MNSRSDRNEEQGEFLKARRAELAPGDVGLAVGLTRRRVKGLRREEVAQLAEISTDYYTRLEQGRLSLSATALTAVARALRLNDDQKAYLRQLSRSAEGRRPKRTPQRVREQTQLLLDNLVDTPALVLGRHMGILAWNPLAAALITDFAGIPEDRRNYIRLAFLDPAVRSLFADWETVARNFVAQLRMDAARYPEDPRLVALVGELSVRDEDFREWWASQQVASRTFGRKTFRHPVAGDFDVDWQTLTTADDHDQTIMIMTAPQGSSSQQALRFVASWAEKPDSEP